MLSRSIDGMVVDFRGGWRWQTKGASEGDEGQCIGVSMNNSITHNITSINVSFRDYLFLYLFCTIAYPESCPVPSTVDINLYMAHFCCSLAPLPKCTVVASFLSNAHSPKCSMSIGKSRNVIGGGGGHCPVRKNNRDTIHSIVTAHDRCSEDEFKIDDDSIQSLASPLNFPVFPECISSTISECVSLSMSQQSHTCASKGTIAI